MPELGRRATIAGNSEAGTRYSRHRQEGHRRKGTGEKGTGKEGTGKEGTIGRTRHRERAAASPTTDLSPAADRGLELQRAGCQRRVRHACG